MLEPVSHEPQLLRPAVEPLPFPVRATRASIRPFLLASGLLLAAAAVVFFYGIKAAPDALQDEGTYWTIAHNFATHGSLSLHGAPFFFHPPLYFLVEGAILKLVGGPADFIYGPLAIRWFDALLGLATLVAILAVGYRALGRGVALVAGMLYMTDPFVLRTIRRNMLEAPAMLPVVISVWLLMGTKPREIKRPILVGICLGIALLIKEYTGFMLVVLAAQWLWPRLARRVRFLADPPPGLSFRQSAIVAGIAIPMYALHPLSAWWTGNWNYFLTVKMPGVQRFLGFLRDTGLHSKNAHAGIVSVIGANLGQYASSYLMLAVGALAGTWLILQARNRETMLLGMWTVIVMVWTAFETVFGLAEEQFYYYALIPAALSIAAVIVTAFQVVRMRGRLLPLAAGVLVAFGLVLGYNGAVWARYYASPDDAVIPMRHYLYQHIPAGTVILQSTIQDQFFYPRYRFAYAYTPKAIAESHAAYAIISSKDIFIGYRNLNSKYARFIHSHGTIVFKAYSSTYWSLQLVKLHQPVARLVPSQAPRGGHGGALTEAAGYTHGHHGATHPRLSLG